ncbi:prepilin-type N-terminal cleavage/methylation domain-containing protein [Dehalococcoidia bacterium]|nr:prepilin-type N-terminal cleavage/methylation domain-containing protein [Dehalococcoidia bacterium]MCL0091090.1 prepilin-type N-terminal cleavage/methylation domain-containing protein [Dehalococcoidia bacterium]
MKGARLIHKDQRGFTLMELLIAIAITGLITGGITMTIFQVFDMNTRASNHMIAVRQVQNAGYWVSRDVQMVESDDIKIGDDPDTTDYYELLRLSWKDWETGGLIGALHNITYYFEESGGIQELHRRHTCDAPLIDEHTIVARHIDSNNTFTVIDYGVVTITITAAYGDVIETRTYKVTPRLTE